ncbi:MAG: hypothetical protein AAF615_04060 [Pseudomonadota bacterium]
MKCRQTILAVLALVFAAHSAAAEDLSSTPVPEHSPFAQFIADGVLRMDAFRAPPPKDGYSYPDCYCTDSSGRRVELGQQVCLTVGRRSVLAVCGMSLNNPAWRFQDEGCPTA